MTIKVGINGFGRMGRLALRAAWDWPELSFTHINDPAGDTLSPSPIYSILIQCMAVGSTKPKPKVMIL